METEAAGIYYKTAEYRPDLSGRMKAILMV